jgi:parallel beta-helix repeat protein
LRKEHGHGGRAGSFLVVKAYPGEKPIFVNGSRPFIIECNYVRIEGIQFRNGKGITIRGATRDGIHVVNNSFTGSGYAWGAVESHGDNILLEGNECDIEGSTVGTQGHCYYISQGTNIIVRNNIAKGATGYGIHIFDQRRSEDPPFLERLIRNVLVEGNVIADSEQRSGIVIAAYDHASIENVTVRNNVIFNNAYFGILVPGIAKNIKIYNNTIFGNKQGTAVYIKGKNHEVRNLRITNNIFDISSAQTGSPFHVVSEDKNTEVIVINNLYWPKPVRLKNVVDSNPITGDPLFVSATDGDFHLKGGSAAIDKGISLEDVPEDRDGIKRPQSSAYDIGAYEYQ